MDKSILVDQVRITAHVAPKSYRSPISMTILSFPVQRTFRDGETHLIKRGCTSSQEKNEMQILNNTKRKHSSLLSKTNMVSIYADQFLSSVIKAY